MKELHRLRRSRAVPPTRPVPPGPVLKAFIGYADIPAVRRATATIGEAMRAAGKRFTLEPLLWRFDQLAGSHWRDRAVTAALEADVIVLASTAPAPLSPPIERWISELVSAARRATTIIAVSGAADAWTICIEKPLPHAAALPLSQPAEHAA